MSFGTSNGRLSGPMQGLALIGGIVFALFVPLILALIEWGLFGTQHVYRFFDRIGLADDLGALYAPLVRLVQGLF